MSPVIQPLVRRAILDLLTSIGGEHSHIELQMLLNQLGHRLAARDVEIELLWLHEKHLVRAEALEHLTVAAILQDGRDVAAGLSTFPGISPYKTGE